MHSTASLLGVWLVASAPICVSACTSWGRGCLAGRMLPWVALVWVVWSGVPVGARRARAVSISVCACDLVWIALPMLAAACALDVVAGRSAAPAITMFVLALAWTWLSGSAATRVAADERAEKIYAWIWLASVPGGVVLVRALAWSHAAGIRGTDSWLASAASISPSAWLTHALAQSGSAARTVARSDAPWPAEHSPFAACSVVIALWALSWWLVRRASSSTPSAPAEPVRGGVE